MFLFFIFYMLLVEVVKIILDEFLFWFADCYDPLDPHGNITVTFDIHQWTDTGYVVSV